MSRTRTIGAPQEAEPARLPEHASGVGRVMEKTLNSFRGTKFGNAVVGLSSVLALGGVVEQATVQDAQAQRTRYFNNEDNFSTTVTSEQVMQCIKKNVGTRDQNSRSPWSFPNGSIERQVVRTRLGSREVSIITTLRDVNLDRTTVSANGNATSEFLYGCTYVTGSNTSLELREKIGSSRRTRPASTEQSAAAVEFQENPRIYRNNQFFTRTFRSVLLLPRGLRRSDLVNGRWCSQTTNRSWNVADPYDNNQVHPAYPGASYGHRLIDPNRERGMLDNGSNSPQPRSRSWTKCIKNLREVTIRPPSNSFWSR